MSSSFLTKIEEDLKSHLFTDEDLKLLFPEKDASALYNSLSYHLKRHHLERLRRGLYALAPKKNQSLFFSKFKLANKLVLHSFISFESALSHHNLIPEAVIEVTSSTLTKSVVFENRMGRFSFTTTPVEPFYLGVRYDELTGARIAHPLRALFDLVYFRRILYKNSKDLESDLRLDLKEFREHLRSLRPAEIMDLGEKYKKKTTRALALLIMRDIL